jgi:hypothetical protein
MRRVSRLDNRHVQYRHMRRMGAGPVRVKSVGLALGKLPVCPYELTCSCTALTEAMGHVWTAPGWQGESSLCSVVGAAMCSACLRGTHDRWP